MKKLIAVILILALITALTVCDSDPIPEPTEIGDVFSFGSYDWLVLDVQGDKALIISEDIIESGTYHADGGDITWEHSSIREYLNSGFYNSFSSAEQGRIAETTIINSDNPTHGTAGGNDTADNIFLLSIDEAEMYFPDDASRIAVNANGHESWWWLRSPGDYSDIAAGVDGGGRVCVR
ncbi:MAG: DUF6273 domain-containing protein, partial [Oscillospiraceae bacterium]|nr:DUF6273 domain-containing protein [Oscillospiraceae bacterium]